MTAPDTRQNRAGRFSSSRFIVRVSRWIAIIPRTTRIPSHLQRRLKKGKGRDHFSGHLSESRISGPLPVEAPKHWDAGAVNARQLMTPSPVLRRRCCSMRIPGHCLMDNHFTDNCFPGSVRKLWPQRTILTNRWHSSRHWRPPVPVNSWEHWDRSDDRGSVVIHVYDFRLALNLCLDPCARRPCPTTRPPDSHRPESSAQK